MDNLDYVLFQEKHNNVSYLKRREKKHKELVGGIVIAGLIVLWLGLLYSGFVGAVIYALSK